MKPSKSVLFGFLLGFAMFIWIGWTVAHSNFNGNQFNATYPFVSVKDGAPFTNTTVWTSLTVNSTNPESYFQGRLFTTNGLVVGTTPAVGMWLVDPFGNMLIYTGTNPPLFMVMDKNTNGFLNAFGSNSLVEVDGTILESNLTSRAYFYNSGTNFQLWLVGTNTTGSGFVTNYAYFGVGVGSNSFKLINWAGQATFALQTNGAAQLGTNAQVTVSPSGDISIHGVPYLWPSANASGTLQNDGAGNISWTPVQGVTIPNTITPTNFVLNTVYTNTSGSIQLLDATVALITAAVAGTSSIDLMADQAGGATFVLQDRVALSTLITGLAQNYTNALSGAVSNNATYYFTNTSSGSGNSVAIVPGTGERITLSDGAAAGVATLGGTQTFTGDNTFNKAPVGNAGALINVNGGAITGGVWRIDIPGFAILPGDTLPATYATNTPGAGTTSIQGAGPSRMMWNVNTSGTNNLYAVFPLPYNYDGGTISVEAWFTGGTNYITKTTNVVSFAASTFGSALGTAITVTNRVDTVGVSTFWTTNSQTSGLTIGGSPTAGRSVTLQVSPWGGSPYFTVTNLLACHHVSVWGTCSTTQRSSITMP